jgi:predicted nucleotidyltransferase
MKDTIKNVLKEIEQKEKITILAAVESGSRAWGFASPDSDYDVRFLYVRQKEYYLRLNRERDVIEFMLDDTLDINGWDFDKTLKLLHSSNPTLFEWLRSPIVYRKLPFIDKLTELSDKYFLIESGLYHYLSMAEGNYREFLKGETVLLKKYFYVLRPLLACLHILSDGTPPPMEFEALLNARMNKDVIPFVEKLLSMVSSAVTVKV